MSSQLRLSAASADIAQHRDLIADLLLDFSPAQHAAWPDKGEALAEVDESLHRDKKRISILAFLDEVVAGWVAGFQTYDHAFELHPLVVKRDCQRIGVGRALLRGFEARAAEMGALTVYLGSDDHVSATSLGGKDLFPGVLRNAQAIRNLNGHAYEFYERCGYEVVGVLPDVNGLGEPDIWMAKPIGRSIEDQS